MDRSFYISFRHNYYNRTPDILIPCSEVLLNYNHLLRVVTDYFTNIGKEFKDEIALDGLIYTLDITFSSLNMYSEKFDIEYRGHLIQSFGVDNISHSVKDMLDALPDINPFKEFRLPYD